MIRQISVPFSNRIWFVVHIAQQANNAVGVRPIFVGGGGLGEVRFHIGEGLVIILTQLFAEDG